MSGNNEQTPASQRERQSNGEGVNSAFSAANDAAKYNHREKLGCVGAGACCAYPTKLICLHLVPDH